MSRHTAYVLFLSLSSDPEQRGEALSLLTMPMTRPELLPFGTHALALFFIATHSADRLVKVSLAAGLHHPAVESYVLVEARHAAHWSDALLAGRAISLEHDARRSSEAEARFDGTKPIRSSRRFSRPD